jgi:hypothetical protein
MCHYCRIFRIAAILAGKGSIKRLPQLSVLTGSGWRLDTASQGCRKKVLATFVLSTGAVASRLRDVKFQKHAH